jgi:hypothetical protein
MPWNEADPMTEKLKFILAASQDYQDSFTRLCRSFGISTKTGYEWLTRYEQLGSADLVDQPPFPKAMPNQLPDDTIALLVATRKEHPTWGARSPTKGRKEEEQRREQTEKETEEEKSGTTRPYRSTQIICFCYLSS